jgi:hypothetical protein
MSSPLETPEFGNLYLGDTNDDDPQVIQSYFTPAPDGPPNVYTEPIPDQGIINAPVLNRMINGSSLMQPTWAQPTQVLPADEFRIMLMVKALSATATDGVSIADNPNNLTSPDGTLLPPLGARIQPADGWVSLGPYTGALCATAFGSAGAITFTFIAVTK